MNAKGPLQRAVIMDLVTTESRGRWNSVQSLSSFTWSGSAALGGYFADKFGDYRYTFAITAIIYTMSGLLLVPLFWLLPKERKKETAVETNSIAIENPTAERSHTEQVSENNRPQ